MVFYCELCGKETKKLFVSEIEGTTLKVCNSCKTFGKESFEFIAEKTREEIKKEKEFSIERQRKQKEDFLSFDIDFVENYAKIIREKRQQLGLSLQELSKKASLPLAELRKIESGKIPLTIQAAKKLEKALHVKLIID